MIRFLRFLAEDPFLFYVAIFAAMFSIMVVTMVLA